MQSKGGIGFVGMLTILFIALKLLGVISWPWWLVLSPVIVSILVIPIIFIIVLFVVTK